MGRKAFKNILGSVSSEVCQRMQLACNFTFWIVNCRQKSRFCDCELCISEMHLSKILLSSFNLIQLFSKSWNCDISKLWNAAGNHFSEIVNCAFNVLMHVTLEQGPVLSFFNPIPWLSRKDAEISIRGLNSWMLFHFLKWLKQIWSDSE